MSGDLFSTKVVIPSIILGVLMANSVPDLAFIFLGARASDIQWVPPGLVATNTLGLIALHWVIVNLMVIRSYKKSTPSLPDLPNEVVARIRQHERDSMDQEILRLKMAWVPASLFLSMTVMWIGIVIHEVLAHGASATGVYPRPPFYLILPIALIAHLVVLFASERLNNRWLDRFSWVTGPVFVVSMMSL